MNFVSPRATVKGCLEGDNVILGPTMIGLASLIGRGVVVGYPSRRALKNVNFEIKTFGIEKYDSVSKGANIGSNCTVRSGTIIYETVTIGDYVETGHNVLIREGSIIEEKSLIGSSTQLDGAVKIGRNVSIQSNVYLPHLTVIEDGVFLAPNVVFTNDLYPVSKRLVVTTVKRDAIIGANACIVAGVMIGKGSVVAAGAVVTKDVPRDTVVVGMPARFYTTRKEYDEKRAEWENRSNCLWSSPAKKKS